VSPRNPLETQMTSHGEWLPKISKAKGNVNYFSIPEGKQSMVQNSVESIPALKVTVHGKNKWHSPIIEEMQTLVR
jgi:hypothetical protein